ncbi:hypothetical protein VCRA2130O400_4230001 [Vibrio crassostreae]|nr:hypothetical protein VCRA2119O381_7810001 [Vibrio crassostreae]CAK3957319.1 hypothetical protein VCRA2130O400_4230001 [Vibrio crassostreae]
MQNTKHKITTIKKSKPVIDTPKCDVSHKNSQQEVNCLIFDKISNLTTLSL